MTNVSQAAVLARLRAWSGEVCPSTAGITWGVWPAKVANSWFDRIRKLDLYRRTGISASIHQRFGCSRSAANNSREGPGRDRAWDTLATLSEADVAVHISDLTA